MLMYFLCFLASRDFEIVWFSHEILSFALLLLFSRLSSCFELNCCSARLFFFLIRIV